MGEFKRWLKKTWKFIWEEDSVLSWIVNIILAFILIKFIVYPGIGFVTGTSHPIVAVVSGSMEHKTVPQCLEFDRFRNVCLEKDPSTYVICGEEYGSNKDVDFDFFWQACGDWYGKHNITKSEFSEYPFSNGFNTGDIIFLKGSPPEEIQKGDVIVFYATKSYPIIHRVVEKKYENGEVVFQTKGDHNEDSGSDDTNITEDRVIGEAVFRIPFVGWIKIAAHKILQGFIQIVN